MPTDEMIAKFFAGETIAVAVDAIEKEVISFWQTATEDKEKLPYEAVREYQLNLLSYLPNEGLYERAVNTLTELTSSHPCRAIAMLADPEAEEDELTAYLSLYRHSPAAGDKTVCCEQITIAAKGKAVRQIPAVAVPLIVDELPVVLWWQDELREDDVVFEQLLTPSHHLIYDSADCRDVGNLLARARALCRQRQDLVCSDLNWLRLLRYIDSVKEFIDRPEMAPLLSHAETIKIEVAATAEGDAHFAQPLLLLGWLAHRLNWKLTEPLTAWSPEMGTNFPTDTSQPVEGSLLRTSWQSNGHEIVALIHVQPVAASSAEFLMPAEVSAIDLAFRQDEKLSRFSWRRDADQPRATLQITQADQTTTETDIPFPTVTLPALMAQALERAGRDQTYEAALNIATQLI